MTETPQRGPLRVRPYALTGGRVRSSTDLPFEALVRVRDDQRLDPESMTSERREICALSQAPISVAELSAHLGLALGVARVVAGDMVTEGILDCHRSPTEASEGRPDLRLLERVLDGLQAL